MHPVYTVVVFLLLCFVVTATAPEPSNSIDTRVRQQAQRIQCSRGEKQAMKQTRHLLRRLLLSMVSLQQCKDRASSDLCTTPPSKFQRHHHCRLLTLLQRSAHSCTDELHCKQQSELVGCSLAWQSNTAALQWLFPRHMYCGDTQVKNVNARCSATFFAARLDHLVCVLPCHHSFQLCH